MSFPALQACIQTYIDDCSDPSSDLLLLRDMLRDMADKANETYKDIPQLFTNTCYKCGVRFSILDTPRESRRPDSCVECYEERSHGQQSCLREPKYAYKRGI